MTSKPLSRRQRIAAILAGTVLLTGGGTAAWALDRFVVDHVEISDVAAYEAVQSSAAAADSAPGSAATSPATTAAATDGSSATSTSSPVITDTSYTNGDTSITITTVVTGTGADTITYYVADIVVGDATSIRSAFANNQFGTNITADTSEIADQVGAVFAINGDYYGFRDTGIVIRNGVVYRDEGTRQGLAFYRDGTITLYDETTTTAAQLVADGVWNTLSFGPGIVQDGQIPAGIESVEVDTNVGNHSIQGDQPRTGVGTIAADHYVFVVVDGRSPGYSKGVTMTEFAQIFVDLGAAVAYNIDGGGSSTMYFNGELVNNPLGNGNERGTSDILYLAG